MHAGVIEVQHTVFGAHPQSVFFVLKERTHLVLFRKIAIFIYFIVAERVLSENYLANTQIGKTKPQIALLVEHPGTDIRKHAFFVADIVVQRSQLVPLAVVTTEPETVRLNPCFAIVPIDNEKMVRRIANQLFEWSGKISNPRFCRVKKDNILLLGLYPDFGVNIFEGNCKIVAF